MVLHLLCSHTNPLIVCVPVWENSSIWRLLATSRQKLTLIERLIGLPDVCILLISTVCIILNTQKSEEDDVKAEIG